MPKGVKIHYTADEMEWLEKNHKLVISEYARQFNERFGRDIEPTALHALRKRNGWKTGRTGQFQPGNVPHPNAGAKGPNKTSFKKGSVPANTVPLYSERISKDGYIEIKVPETDPHTGRKTRFMLKHRLVWEQAGMAIPPNHILRFIDGDKTNCSLDNLELMPRGVNAILNKHGYADMPEEIKPTVKAIAMVQHKISEVRSTKRFTNRTKTNNTNV